MLPETVNSTSGGVSLIFLLSNFVLLVPSVLILVAVLGTPAMRTCANLLVGQIAVLDILYATWALSWHTLKLAEPSVGTPFMCSFEGAVSNLFLSAWLYGATLCAYYRYHAVIYGREVEKKRLAWIWAMQWAVPVALTLSIALGEGFSLMPSGGYCYLAYRDDAGTQALYVVTMLVVLVPTALSIYFYVAITRHCCRIANLAQIRDNQQLEYYQSFDKTPQMASSLYSCHAVAYRAIMHSSIFIFSFVPFGITMVYELTAGVPRSSDLDVVVIAAVLAHKVMSPVVSLLINTAILNRVKELVHLR